VIGDKLYAAGGANAASGALKTLEIYSFKRRRWARGPDMATAREHLAGAVAGRVGGGAFYVLAGRAAGRGNFRVAERYLPAQRRWEQLPDMRKARGGIAAASVGGRVVVFGGEESSGTIREVEIYDPGTRRWSALPDMPTPRHGLGGVSREQRVYAIEGGPTPGFDFSNVLEALDIVPARIAGP
jgi:N-acetylneuraminic acid mutarotase